MNANKRLREGSSSSSMSDISDSELSLKCIMEKLESIQQSLVSNFAEAMSEINSLHADRQRPTFDPKELTRMI